MRTAAVAAIVALCALPCGRAEATVLTQELILEVRVHRTVLSEAIIAYESNGRVYLPLTEMARALEFPLELDIEHAFAEGWFLQETRTFSLDAARGELVREGRESRVPLDAFIDGDLLEFGELYVDAIVLQRLWPLNLIIDMPKLAVIVEPMEPLPVQARAERMRRRDLLLARRAEDFDAAEFANPYRSFSAPVIDYESDLRVEKDRTASTHTITGAHDLLGLGTSWFASAESEDGHFDATDLRLTLRRAAAAAPLPFGMEDIQGGDVVLPNLRLVVDSRRGRGAVFSSFPNHEADVFDRTTIEGDGIPGWEVELYRNNELVRFEMISSDGRYRFENVQLVFGVNRLRVVLYGPQGQLREYVDQIVVGDEMAPPGQLRFRVGAIEAGHDLFPVGDDRSADDGLLVLGEAAYGLSQRASVFGRVSRVPTTDGDRTYMLGGLAASVLGGYTQLELHHEIDGGGGADFQFATSFGPTSISTGLTYLDDFESPLVGFGRSRIEFRARGRADTFVATPIGQLSLTVATTHERRRSGFEQTEVETRQSIGLRRLRVTNNTNTLLRNAGSDITAGDFSLSTGTGQLRLRAGVDYELEPNLEADSASSTVTYTFDRDWIVSLDVSHDMETSMTSTGGVLTHDFGFVLFGLDGGWNSNDDFNVGLRISLAFGPGLGGAYEATSMPRTTQGALRARVFLDRDGDSIFGPGDEPLPEVRLLIGKRRSRKITDEGGNLILMDLPSLVARQIRIDETSLIDPYWMPSNGGYTFVGRPGVVPQLDLPVLETGAIDGVVRLASSDREVAGVKLELVDGKGEVLGTSVSSFDGFYVFEHVRPGSYTVRAAADSRMVVAPSSTEVSIEDPFVIGLDLTARRRSNQ